MRIAMGALALLGCGGGEKGTDSAAGSAPDDAAASALWDTIQAASDWQQVDDWSGVQPSDTAHDAFTQVWWNDTAFDHVTGGGMGDMPVGSVIFKESYSDAGGASLTGTTAMSKEADGWFWASWTDVGELRTSGEPGLCTGCHDAGQDGVLTTTW